MGKSRDEANLSLVLWVVGALIVFWAVAIPAVALSKPFGTDNGAGVAIPK